MTQEEDDNALLEAIQAGSRQAFNRLVQRHAHYFFNVARRLVRQREDAEDIVQDAFLKLWRNPFSYQVAAQSKFTSWFYRVVANGCMDRLRKVSHVNIDDVPEMEDAGAGIEEQLILDADEQNMLKAVYALPPQQQVAVQLFYYDGFSQSEAAEVMRLHLKAFESLLYRARLNLKKKMLEGTNLQEKNKTEEKLYHETRRY